MDPIETLKEYLKHASVSTDPNYKEGVEGARKFVCDQLKKIGFDVTVVKTPLNPIIWATKGDNPEWPLVMLYAHYDVQPADPFDLWDHDPFDPIVKGDRIYARGACDNKGPFIVQLAALSNLYKKYPNFPLRIIFLIEGEEEIGSPSFKKFLDEYREKFKEADFMLISDTMSPGVDQIMITTSIRGIIDIDVELAGPTMDLHSGLFGGAVLNPIQALCDICASLHNKDGTVNVPGFYDDVIQPEGWEKEEVKRYPIKDVDFKKITGVKEFRPMPGLTPIESTLFAPTLEFNGIGGGYQGHGGKTIIPSKAFVKITCRLVGNQEPEKIRKLVIQAIKDRCPKEVSLSFENRSGGAPYLVVPPNRSNSPKPYPKALKNALEATEKGAEEIFGNKVLYMRSGGSLPIIGTINKVTGLDCVMIGLCTPEDKMHSPNESFHLGLMKKAIKLYERILERIAGI